MIEVCGAAADLSLRGAEDRRLEKRAGAIERCVVGLDDHCRGGSNGVGIVCSALHYHFVLQAERRDEVFGRRVADVDEDEGTARRDD